MEAKKIKVEDFPKIYFEEKVEPLDSKEILFFALSFGFIVVSILIGVYTIVESLFNIF